MKQKPTGIKLKRIIGSLLAVVFLSAGCGGGDPPAPKNIVLNFWDPFENTENLQELFSTYQQRNPNVQIVYTKKNILGSAGIATPPKTWSELAQNVQKIRRADKTGYFTLSGLAAGTNANVNRAVDILYLFMLQKGVVPYTQGGGQPAFSQNIIKNGNSINPGLEGLN